MEKKPLTALVTTGPPGPKSVLDGNLLCIFLSLSLDQQKDLARGVGSTVERIIDDICKYLNCIYIYLLKYQK